MKPFREKGVPAVLQIEDMTYDFNRYYHGAGDTVDHMDRDYWIAQVKALVAAMAHLAVPLPPGPTPTPVPSPTSTPSPTPTMFPTSIPVPSPTPTPLSSSTPLQSPTPFPSTTATASFTPVTGTHSAYFPILEVTGR